MNDDFLRYKTRFLTFALLLGYAFLHISLTGSYVDVTFDKQIDFTTRLPFGQRLLVPAMAHFISYFISINSAHLFFLLEWLFVSALYFALIKLLEMEFKLKQAQLFSWLFLLLLPLMTVINYRFTTGGTADFFYSYDTASLFFLVVGFLLCLKMQWYYFIPWVFLATFNRESSILLVLLIPALHWKKLKTLSSPLLFALCAYILARFIVFEVLKGTPGQWMEFYTIQPGVTFFEANFYWLFSLQHILMFLFCFAGLPLFWFAFYDYIPSQYRHIRYVLLFYFIGLSMVGIFREGRLFSEIAVLIYLPVCVAVSNWLNDIKPDYLIKAGILPVVERYFVLLVLVFIILFHKVLNSLIIWLVSN